MINCSLTQNNYCTSVSLLYVRSCSYHGLVRLLCIYAVHTHTTTVASSRPGIGSSPTPPPPHAIPCVYHLSLFIRPWLNLSGWNTTKKAPSRSCQAPMDDGSIAFLVDDLPYVVYVSFSSLLFLVLLLPKPNAYPPPRQRDWQLRRKASNNFINRLKMPVTQYVEQGEPTDQPTNRMQVCRGGKRGF